MSLSDKIRDLYEHETGEQQSILVKYIKEAIKELKEEFEKRTPYETIYKKIDKIFGDELT